MHRHIDSKEVNLDKRKMYKKCKYKRKIKKSGKGLIQIIMQLF